VRSERLLLRRYRPTVLHRNDLLLRKLSRQWDVWLVSR
jgi:hypothetical protein